MQVKDSGDRQQDVVVADLDLLIEVGSARAAGAAALGTVAFALAVAVAAPTTAASALVVAILALGAWRRSSRGT